MKLYCVCRDKFGKSIILQSDLKTERGYLNRVHRRTGEFSRVVSVDFIKSTLEGFYGAKAYKAVFLTNTDQTPKPGTYLETLDYEHEQVTA